MLEGATCRFSAPSKGDNSLISEKDIDSFAKKCKDHLGIHFIDGICSPLNPHAWLNILYDGVSWDSDALFILDGVYNGFRVVDPAANDPVYDCKNYNSCFESSNLVKMKDIFSKELEEGKISLALTKPSQIHALGAIPKPGGAVHHITDCSRPKNI